MVNEQTMLHKYELLQQLSNVPTSIKSLYAELLISARRADQLARQCRQAEREMHSNAISLDNAIERLWSQVELTAVRSNLERQAHAERHSPRS
jgi:hypothetical protein